MQKRISGFTIVELLIVIVVIAILAAISLVAYNGIQSRGKIARATSEINQLQKAIVIARTQESKTLAQITGGYCTRCTDTQASYDTALNAIQTASGVNLESLKAGDPWGYRYGIDENEGESGGCARDRIQTMNTEIAQIIVYIPISGYSGCP